MNILNTESHEKISINLPEDGELCIIVPLNEGRAASISVQNSTATNDPRVDCMGAPMIPGVNYRLLAGESFSIYSWTSAVIDIQGSSSLLKNVFRNPVKSLVRPIVEYHCLLHQIRADADKKGDIGPVVLLCGNNSSGKSCIARSLCSYAARSGWKPLLVDLDNSVSQMIGVPGSIGAAVVEYPIVMDEIISQSLVTFSYFTGFLECQRTTHSGSSMSPTYVNYTTLLLDLVKDRLYSHIGTTIGSSGAIIVLPELVGMSGVNFAIDIAEKYMGTNILCCNDDFLFHKLYSRFCEDIPIEQVQTKVDKISSTYVAPAVIPHEIILPKLFKDFFYGNGPTNLLPQRWARGLDKVKVFQLKDDNNKAGLDSVQLESLQGIVGCIAALYPDNQPQSILTASPLTVGKIDTIDATGIQLLTATHSLPYERICLVVGSVRWISS